MPAPPKSRRYLNASEITINKNQQIKNNAYRPAPPQFATPAGTSWTADAFAPKVVIRAVYMALIVGTILVMINHGMCIYNGKFNFTCFWQSALTYLVPYSVSTISSVLTMRGN